MKCSLTKKIPVALHNGSSYDCHLLIKESAEEFKNQFTYFGEKTEKYITFTVPIVIRIDKNGEKLQKIYLTYYILLIVQNLWKAHYQILSIIVLKEFIELINVNTDTMTKNVKLAELNIATENYCNCFLEYTNFKDD